MNVKLIEPTKQEIAEDLHQLMLMISIDDENSCFPKFKLFILKCLKLRLLQNNVLERQSQRRSSLVNTLVELRILSNGPLLPPVGEMQS